jgi:hypothetical protein
MAEFSVRPSLKKIVFVYNKVYCLSRNNFSTPLDSFQGYYPPPLGGSGDSGGGPWTEIFTRIGIAE